MIRTATLTAVLLVGGFGCSDLASAQCYGGRCFPGVSVVVSAPPLVYQPQVTYQPLQHRGSYLAAQPRFWQGPIWTSMFGRYRFGVAHYYAPVQQQQQSNGNGAR